MGKTKQINNSSVAALKSCSVVIKCENCPLCRRSFKCATDVRNHIIEMHNNNLSKKSGIHRKKKNIRLILKVGNEIISCITLKRKYLGESVISITSKQNHISNDYFSHNKHDCPSRVMNNNFNITQNLKIAKDLQVSERGFSQDQSISDTISYKSNIIPNSPIENKLNLWGNGLTMQKNDNGFSDKSQPQRSYIFGIDGKENKFEPIKNTADTNMGEKSNNHVSSNRSKVKSHYSDPLGENIKLHKKECTQTNISEKILTKAGDTCSTKLQNNRNNTANKLQHAEDTSCSKNNTTCNVINLSSNKPYYIKDERDSVVDNGVQEIFVRTKNTTVIENTKEDVPHKIRHTNGRMLLWNAIKEMRKMDCYMTETEKSIKDIDRNYRLINRDMIFPMSACT